MAASYACRSTRSTTTHTDDDEIEDIWLPVLASLQALLGAGVEPCDPRVVDSLTTEPALDDE